MVSLYEDNIETPLNKKPAKFHEERKKTGGEVLELSIKQQRVELTVILFCTQTALKSMEIIQSVCFHPMNFCSMAIVSPPPLFFLQFLIIYPVFSV